MQSHFRVDRHGSRTLNEVWNPDTLAWEAMSQISVTVDSLTVSGIAISNLPHEYKISHSDDASDPSYYGFLDKDGGWYILRITSSTGLFEYVKGASGYPTAWTNRATQTYGAYDAIF